MEHFERKRETGIDKKENAMIKRLHDMATTGRKVVYRTFILSAILLSGCISGSSDCGDADAEAEARAIVNTIYSWLEPYKGELGINERRYGATTYLYGSFGDLQSVFNRFNLTFAIDEEERQVLCFGYLPTTVPEDRRREMIEFIFRGEWEYGLSTATMVLDEDGNVRCQAWLPFESFTLQPKESQWRLIGAVVDKLWSFSNGATGVALGIDPVTAACGIKRINLFEGMEEAAMLEKAADVDTKIVLERCFDQDDEITTEISNDEWLNALSGCGGDVSVGIINAKFQDIAQVAGGPYDVLPYSLVVREGMVWNICTVPDECPNTIIGDVAGALMKINEGRKHGMFGIDFDTGKIWCHYAVPVSVIPSRDENPPRIPYAFFIRGNTVYSIAKLSEALQLTMAEVPPDSDVAEPVDEPSMGSDPMEDTMEDTR